MQLDLLILQVLEELQKSGMKKSTIRSYKDSAYGPIQNYCARNGTSCYEVAILSSFLMGQYQRLEKKEISGRHYRRLRRAVYMLQDLSEHGTLPKERYSAGPKYKVNEHFNTCLQEFLKAQRVSKGTLGTVKSILLHFLNHLEANGYVSFATLMPVDIKNYLIAAASTYPGSMGNVLYAISHFLKYLTEATLASCGLDEALSKTAKRNKKILPCFTHDEVVTILEQIDINTAEGKRDYAILFLASHTGLRSIDITNLRLTDLDWYKNAIQIIQRKTRRALSLPLDPSVGNAIATYILEARPKSNSEYVFLRTVAPHRKLADIRSLGNILEKYRKKAGIAHHPGDGKSFHALRRSLGTWMLESGASLTTISQVLGHKNQDSSKPYLAMDAKKLEECALDFHGIPVERGPFVK